MNLAEALSWALAHPEEIVEVLDGRGYVGTSFSYSSSLGMRYRGHTRRENDHLKCGWAQLLALGATFRPYVATDEPLATPTKETPEDLYKLFGCNGPHVARLVDAMRREYGKKGPQEEKETKKKEKPKNVRNRKTVTKKRKRGSASH